MKNLTRQIKYIILSHLYWRTIFRNINNKLKNVISPKGKKLKFPIKKK